MASLIGQHLDKTDYVLGVILSTVISSKAQLIGQRSVIQASDWLQGIPVRRSDQDRCYEPCTRSLESEMSEQTLLSYL